MLLEETQEENGVCLSDEEVLAQSVGAPRLFSIIVDRYGEAFLRKARRILGNRDEVEDVVSETFTKIYINAGKFQRQAGASFSSWAYKILLNTSFSYYQKLKRAGENSYGLPSEAWGQVSDQIPNFGERATIRDLVATGLARIPESLARILTLHYIEDRPQKEIAEMEGVSISAVKTRIHRAKKSFKDMNLSLVDIEL